MTTGEQSDWRVQLDEALHELQQSAKLLSISRAFVRLTWTTDGPRVELIRPDQLHCATCQCNKIHGTAPMPDNPRSRSWHANAMTEPPKS
jgi:hypothetical protein